jgi:hypothetical protein
MRTREAMKLLNNLIKKKHRAAAPQAAARYSG